MKLQKHGLYVTGVVALVVVGVCLFVGLNRDMRDSTDATAVGFVAYKPGKIDPNNTEALASHAEYVEYEILDWYD